MPGRDTAHFGAQAFLPARGPQSCTCEQVEHIGVVFPAPWPLANAGVAANRNKIMMTACFIMACLAHVPALKSGLGAPLDLDRHVAETREICQTFFVEARRSRLVGDDRRDNRVVSRPNSP